MNQKPVNNRYNIIIYKFYLYQATSPPENAAGSLVDLLGTGI
jgi:hypothetical protein